MKKLILACMLAVLGMMCGCGSSDTSLVGLSYVERTNATSNAPKVFFLETAHDTTTASPIAVPTGAGYVTVSPNGNMVAYRLYNSTTTNYDLNVITAAGTAKTVASSTWYAITPAFSPDGTTLVYSDEGALYTVGVDGSNKKLVFSDQGADYSPAFSPDGKTLSFFRYVGNAPLNSANLDQALIHASHSNLSTQPSVTATYGIYTIPVSGGTSPTHVLSLSGWLWGPAVFSADGKKLLFANHSGTNYTIASVNVDGTGGATLAETAGTDYLAPVPFGDRIYYNSTTDWNSVSICFMNTDGSNKTTVKTTTNGWNFLNDLYWTEEYTW